MSKMDLVTEGERFVIVKRRFEAPPEAVYRAHMDPEMIQQWMLGPEGWTMPVCVNEGKPGGKLRYEWSDGKGGGFFLTGEIVELDPPHRIVHNGCICPIPRRTTTSSPRSPRTAREPS